MFDYDKVTDIPFCIDAACKCFSRGFLAAIICPYASGDFVGPCDFIVSAFCYKKNLAGRLSDIIREAALLCTTKRKRKGSVV